MTDKRIRPPVHPGRTLLREFMEPYNLSARRMATLMGLPYHNRITELTSGRRAITPDTAVRLEKLFGMSVEAWLNLQQRFDLETAKALLEEDETIQNIERYKAA